MHSSILHLVSRQSVVYVSVALATFQPLNRTHVQVMYLHVHTCIHVHVVCLNRCRWLVSGIAESLNSRVYVTHEKKATLECLQDARISSRVVRAPLDARVHVVPMRDLKYQVPHTYMYMYVAQIRVARYH